MVREVILEKIASLERILWWIINRMNLEEKCDLYVFDLSFSAHFLAWLICLVNPTIGLIICICVFHMAVNMII